MLRSFFPISVRSPTYILSIVKLLLKMSIDDQLTGEENTPSTALQVTYPLYHFLLSHGAKFFYGSSSQALCGPIPTAKRRSLQPIPDARFLLSILNQEPGIFVCFEIDVSSTKILVLEVPKDDRMHSFVENSNSSSILHNNERSTFFVRTPSSVLFFFFNERFKQKRAGVITSSGVLVNYFPKGFFTVWGNDQYESLQAERHNIRDTDDVFALHKLPNYLRPTSIEKSFFHKGRFRSTLTPNDFYEKLSIPVDFKGDLKQLSEDNASRLQQLFLLYSEHYPFVADYPSALYDIFDSETKKLLQEGHDEGYEVELSGQSDSDDDEEGEGGVKPKARLRPSREAKQQQAKAEYHTTAKIYKTLFGEKWRFHRELDAWYEWDESHWLKKTYDKFFQEFKTANINYVSNRVYLGSSIATLLSAIHVRLPLVKDALSFSSTEPPLGINFLNGYLDALTLKFQSDRSELPLFSVCNAHYSPNLPTEELLDKIGSLIEYNENSMFLFRTLIYRLIIPVEALQTIVCFTGLTDTGKSMLTKVLTELVGVANSAFPSISHFGHRFITAEYIYKRFVVVTEADGITAAADTHFRKIGELQQVETKGRQETVSATFSGVFLLLSNKSASELTKRSMALRARMVSLEFVRHSSKLDPTLQTFLTAHIGELVNWALGIKPDQLNALIRAHEFVQGTGLDSTPIGRFVCKNFKIAPGNLLRMSTVRGLYKDDREELALEQNIGDEELERALKQYAQTVLGTKIYADRLSVLNISETLKVLEQEGINTGDLDDLTVPVVKVKRNTPNSQRIKCISGFRIKNNQENSLLDEVESKQVSFNPWNWDEKSPLYGEWQKQEFQKRATKVFAAGRKKLGLDLPEVE